MVLTEKERAEEDEDRNERILEKYLKRETQEAIAEKENLSGKGAISNILDKFKNGTGAEIEPDPNLYDVWNYNTNDDKYGFKDYPGRIPGQIVENVLHRYTKPFDINPEAIRISKSRVRQQKLELLIIIKMTPEALVS